MSFLALWAAYHFSRSGQSVRRDLLVVPRRDFQMHDSLTNELHSRCLGMFLEADGTGTAHLEDIKSRLLK